MDHHKLQNKNRVSIIYISWEKELDETLKKLQDLHKSGVIAYAKICALEKPIDNTIPRIHIILRLHIQKSILQIKKYFPAAVLENIVSWSNIKDKMCRNALDNHLKSFEIGEDSKSKQATKKRHYEQRKSMKRSELFSRSHIQALDDIVELQNNSKTRRTDLISHIFNERPDLIRERHQGIKISKRDG